MKLEIGAGNSKREGFIHTDLNLIDGHHVEVVCRGEELPFKDKAFDEIFMWGVFEHFTYNGAWRLLLECNRVLCLGGLVEFSTPDLIAVCKIVASGKLPFVDECFKDSLSFGIACLYGGQDRPGQIHQAGWTEEKLREALDYCKFEVALFDRNAYQPDSHLHFIARKHLDFIARKDGSL